MGYRYKIGLSEHSDQADVSSSEFESLPESIRAPRPTSPPVAPETVPMQLRVFSFGSLEKVAPLPPVGRYPIVEFGMMLGVALFWNGILSVFLYQAWVRPYRVRKSARFMLTPRAHSGTGA